jgi:DNA-binding CsgD family transcriptional regulator
MTELGISRNWLGELAAAELHLTAAVGVARSRDLPGLAAVAGSHLAFTEYMAGREHGCAAVAGEVMALVPPGPPLPAAFARDRAELARLLAALVDLPPADEPPPRAGPPPRVHTADLTTRFWARMRDARLRLMAGSVAGAERELTTPLDVPVPGPLPEHLQVALLVERAFLAALASDHRAIRDLEEELVALDVEGERALVAGLRADLAGDRRAAVSCFAEAAEATTYHQPASRALALSCEAQLLDVLGEPDAAIARLTEAAGTTEVRRNAVPFLGWSRQGTPMATLLQRLGSPREERPTTWAAELAAAADGRPDVVAVFSPTTATVRERESTAVGLVSPLLSPREREVLNGLGRGATYADIAASLFVSENTVKTHVSSLYGKLAASRRSEALAVARRLNLL